LFRPRFGGVFYAKTDCSSKSRKVSSVFLTAICITLSPLFCDAEFTTVFDAVVTDGVFDLIGGLEKTVLSLDKLLIVVPPLATR